MLIFYDYMSFLEVRLRDLDFSSISIFLVVEGLILQGVLSGILIPLRFLNYVIAGM